LYLRTEFEIVLIAKRSEAFYQVVPIPKGAHKRTMLIAQSVAESDAPIGQALS
jgi:hypothetical protein